MTAAITPPPPPAGTIHRKAVQIQQAARYLQQHVSGAEESETVYRIYQLAREVEALVDDQEGEAA